MRIAIDIQHSLGREISRNLRPNLLTQFRVRNVQPNAKNWGEVGQPESVSDHEKTVDSEFHGRDVVDQSLDISPGNE
jgi:hypothetical protein